jgi:hypothetical protein
VDFTEKILHNDQDIHRRRDKNMKSGKFLPTAILLGAAVIGSACILQTAGPGNTPQVIVVTATTGGASQNPSQEAQPSPTREPTWTLTAVFTPSITATFTTTPVTMTAGQDLSCVTGPDWKLYEWVTKIPKGETVTLIARSVPEIPDYYVARTGDGKECWAFGGSSTISGSTASLPVRETPPLPTVDFIIRNRVYASLISVFIRPAGDSAWGANRLSASMPINGEAAISITAGYYDVRVLGPFSLAMYEAYNRAIGPDDTYRILEVAPDVDFTIRNDFPFSICWIDVQPSGGSWQKLYATEDGGGSIFTGNTRDFTLRAGAYGVRLTRCTSAVLPATGWFISPGMFTIVLS